MARKSEKQDGPRLTPKKAKNAVGVAKVLIPAVAPVVVPIAMRAATAVREGAERMRARRLGVGVDELASFSGRGGALHARIAGDVRGLKGLAERGSASESDREFVNRELKTLDTLTTAVRAAERMPAARRKSTQHSVAAELDRVERELLHRLAVA